MAPTYEAATVGMFGDVRPSPGPKSERALRLWLNIACASLKYGGVRALEVRDLSTGQLVRIKPRGK